MSWQPPNPQQQPQQPQQPGGQSQWQQPQQQQWQPPAPQPYQDPHYGYGYDQGNNGGGGSSKGPLIAVLVIAAVVVIGLIIGIIWLLSSVFGGSEETADDGSATDGPVAVQGFEELEEQIQEDIPEQPADEESGGQAEEAPAGDAGAADQQEPEAGGEPGGISPELLPETIGEWHLNYLAGRPVYFYGTDYEAGNSRVITLGRVSDYDTTYDDLRFLLPGVENLAEVTGFCSTSPSREGLLCVVYPGNDSSEALVMLGSGASDDEVRAVATAIGKHQG